MSSPSTTRWRPRSAEGAYSGTIYAAYVGYEPTQDPNGYINATTNTDIYLSYYNPSTGRWVSSGVVNDDNADTDGYSSASTTFGRTQFQPAIAVDQATGTVVVSWRDARDDAANARVATYIGASTDGGKTFSARVMPIRSRPRPTRSRARRTASARKRITNPPETRWRTASFGYGDQMGLAVFDGQVYPVWAGNFNEATDPSGTIIPDPLNIWYRPMVIAAGPRIINSTMGPIPLAEAEGESVGISVTFDRPITPSSFVMGDVSVFYHNTVFGDAYVPLTVLGITEQSSTQYTVFFNPLPPGAHSGDLQLHRDLQLPDRAGFRRDDHQVAGLGLCQWCRPGIRPG